MTEILNRIQDPNKKVQAAACSAFATLEEEAEGELIPYLPLIIQHIMHAFQRYQAKNLTLLFDTLSALADSVGAGLAAPELVQQILPAILHKWQTFEDTDRNMFPLFECLTSVIQAVGIAAQEHVVPIFQRAHTILHTALQQIIQGNTAIDRELVVCALDLISAVIDGLSTRADLASELVANSQLVPLIVEALKTEHPEACQSAFALIGDMTKNCLPHLAGHLETLLPLMTRAVNPQAIQAGLLDKGRHVQAPIISLSNNGCWAYGEIAKRVGPNMKQYHPAMVQSLIETLVMPNMIPALLLNMTISLGRISLHCPDLVAPHLDKVALVWCYRICRMRHDVEKEDSCTGLCNCVALNAQAIVPAFVPFLIAVNSWHGKTPSTLKATFQQLLQAFAQQLGMPISKWLSDPNVLQSLAQQTPQGTVSGLDIIEHGIGWNAQWQGRRWCPNTMAKELAEQGYSV